MWLQSGIQLGMLKPTDFMDLCMPNLLLDSGGLFANATIKETCPAQKGGARMYICNEHTSLNGTSLNAKMSSELPGTASREWEHIAPGDSLQGSHH